MNIEHFTEKAREAISDAAESSQAAQSCSG